MPVCVSCSRPSTADSAAQWLNNSSGYIWFAANSPVVFAHGQQQEGKAAHFTIPRDLSIPTFSHQHDVSFLGARVTVLQLRTSAEARNLGESLQGGKIFSMIRRE
jgi:hypothetical protein